MASSPAQNEIAKVVQDCRPPRGYHRGRIQILDDRGTSDLPSPGDGGALIGRAVDKSPARLEEHGAPRRGASFILAAFLEGTPKSAGMIWTSDDDSQVDELRLDLGNVAAVPGSIDSPEALLDRSTVPG
jgi:hypothetical protein